MAASMVGLSVALNRDIDGWLARARAATTAELMAGYIDNAIKGLDKWNMHEGTWALIWVNPDTQIEYSRELLMKLRDRALQIEKTQTQGSMGYAESMEEIKRTFMTIHMNTYEYYTLRPAIWLYPLIVPLLMLMLIILGLGLLINFDEPILCAFGWHEWVKSRYDDSLICQTCNKMYRRNNHE